MSNQIQDHGKTISGGGYESRSSAVFAVTVAMITCSTVFVFARLASRAGIVKKVLLDDYFILAAWVCLVHLGSLRGPLLTTTLEAARLWLVLFYLLRLLRWLRSTRGQRARFMAGLSQAITIRLLRFIQPCIDGRKDVYPCLLSQLIQN